MGRPVSGSLSALSTPTTTEPSLENSISFLVFLSPDIFSQFFIYVFWSMEESLHAHIPTTSLVVHWGIFTMVTYVSVQ